MTDPAASRRGRNNKNRGKALERRVRDILRSLWPGNTAERVLDQGRRYSDIHFEGACPLCGDGDNYLHCVVEVKSRQTSTPAYLREAWDQATKSSDLTNRTPFVTLSYVDDGQRVFWLVTKLEERS